MQRPWVKIDATYVEDDKILEVGALPELLFLRSIAYCRRRATDGVVTPAASRALAFGIPDTVEALVEALVAVELWVLHPEGWYVRSYEKWQQTNSQLASEAARKRAERQRDKQEKQVRDVRTASDGRPLDAGLFAVKPPETLRSALHREATA